MTKIDVLLGRLRNGVYDDFSLRDDARATIERLRDALRTAARNDKSQYEHHEPRPFDGHLPDGGTIWLTPREIARKALGEPRLATLSEALELRS